MNHAIFGLIFVPVLAAVFFTFVVALVWLAARRKERQAFYFSETVKKLSDSGGSSAADFLREYERTKSRRIREGMTIAGLVGSLAAVGLMIFLHAISQGPPIYLVALIPLLACVGLLISARFLVSRE